MPSITNANGSPSFSITPSSFLHVSDIGKRVYFRIKTCNGLFSENEIFYRLTSSAPHFNNAKSEDTTCYDEINGSVTFNFDRDLEAGEKLGINLINTTNVTSNNDFSEENIENDIINKSYTVNDLPSGMYEASLAQF